ncbi:MAG: response regulator transcription factor [Candidatus Binatus sp.]|jgi:DNA-binding NarL/FixJ family response regulator|uniref:response regulator n=1 Tax=Candidatus Binatus sp. TaxID=2811406 RepID=UPI003C725650
MAKRLRLIIADDHSIFRQGLKELLLLQPDVEVVGEVARFSDLASMLTTTSCDVLLLDLQMERWVGGNIERLSRITRVVVLTASERKEDAMAALRMGAHAFVQKRYAVETLMEAIRSAARGLVWIPPALQAELAAQLRSPASRQLSDRETEIIRCIGLGLRNAEVARRLSIGESTVKTHLNNIFQKLGIRDRVELALYAQRVGLAEGPRGKR